MRKCISVDFMYYIMNSYCHGMCSIRVHLVAILGTLLEGYLANLHACQYRSLVFKWGKDQVCKTFKGYVPV